MARPPTHTKFHCRVPTKGDHRDTKAREQHAHAHVGYALRVRLAALELKLPIVSREQACETDEHLAQRRMHVEVELAFEVVRAELSKVSLVPNDDVRVPNFVEARPARKEGINCGSDVLCILVEEFALRLASD